MNRLYSPSEYEGMPHYKRYPLIGLVLLLAGTFACSFFNSDPKPTLRDRLGGQINQAQQVEQQAADLWDRVLFGETVNCGEIITVPEPFFLTVKEAEEHPQSVAIRDSLNNALGELTHAADLWEQECQFDRSVVPLEVVREAEDALQSARDLLNQSASAWTVWQA